MVVIFRELFFSGNILGRLGMTDDAVDLLKLALAEGLDFSTLLMDVEFSAVNCDIVQASDEHLALFCLTKPPPPKLLRVNFLNFRLA